jgi:hypothetical protein
MDPILTGGGTNTLGFFRPRDLQGVLRAHNELVFQVNINCLVSYNDLPATDLKMDLPGLFHHVKHL